MQIQRIRPTDYKEMYDLQKSVYPSVLQESLVVLSSKVYCSPNTCFLAHDGDGFCGYILSIPYPAHLYPQLDESVFCDSESPNLYIADCVITPSFQGQGIATELAEVVEATARVNGFSSISLVAIEGADSFWQDKGYKPFDGHCNEIFGVNSISMIKEL